ncbi:DUF2663 family protein [Virgibacillus siamensis]|uniref:DUF2663 family protein n=1 Tax=Virgibacillus siamensis TaxID=480071 RepID=UPI0009860AA6|nr:DUF2663 family protein [Virgibacillus siamensis]
MKSWEDYVTNDTLNMICKLKEINEKINEKRNKITHYSKIAMCSISAFCIYALTYVYFQDNILFGTANFLSNFYHLTWIAFTILIFLKLNNANSEISKLEKKLENLRQETIDHLKNTWYISEHTDIRDQISDYMKNQGINLNYKSR